MSIKKLTTTLGVPRAPLMLPVTRAATHWKLPENSPAMISAPSSPPPPQAAPNLRTRSLKYPTISKIHKYFTNGCTMPRLFLYFPQKDILLTTLRSYAWTYESRVGLRASTLTALVLSTRYLRFAPTFVQHGT